MSSAYAVTLDASCTTDPAALGGKGASLARLIRAGVPVPQCAVVCTDSYRAVAADPRVASMIETARRSSDESPVDASVVDTVFAGVPLPARVEAAIVDTVLAFGDASLAVRSSATAEDMHGASFAGQYRSTLGMRGTAAVLDAVRATWASLWHPSAIAYRRAWGADDDEVAMAAVLMRMVDADMAGVVFTVDPAGEASNVHVEAVSGLGEQLVSGAATPSVWTFPRVGVDTADVPDPVRRATALSLQIAELERTPQDVEWAWDGHTTWIVQARPITTFAVDEFDSPTDEHELTTEGIAEMLPGVLPPLIWDVNAFLVEEAFRQTLAEVGALPHSSTDDGRQFVRRVDGRAALDFDLMCDSAAALHEDAAAELERRYFGHATQRDDSAKPRRRRRGRLGQALRTGAARRRALENAGVVVEIADAFDGASPALERESDRWLLRYRRRVIDLGARAMAAELAVAAVAIAAADQLEALLGQSLDRDEAGMVARELTSAAGCIPSPPVHASRAVFGGSTWDELPDGAPDIPRRDIDEAANRRRIEADLEARPEWRTSRFIGAEIIDVRAHLLRRLADDATHALRTREMTKRAVLIIGGELRRVHLELARRLIDVGVVASTDDIDCLGNAELDQTVITGVFPAGLLQQRKRALARAAARPPLPQRFRGRPHRSSAAAPVPALAPSHEITLRGWAASAGSHTGTARVVRDASSPNDLEAGDVLVAEATDASWLPLFLRAGAIVVERGGPLSHAAIVARELGLPAVLNVEGATTALDGRLVTIDGDEGSVQVHARVRR